MSATENKELIRNVWAEASKGNAEGFLNALADDVHYTIIGTTKFSGTFNGKQDLLNRAFVPLISELETNDGMETRNLIAEGDYVVQQVSGSGEGRSRASRTTTPTASCTSWWVARSPRSRSTATPSW